MGKESDYEEIDHEEYSRLSVESSCFMHSPFVAMLLIAPREMQLQMHG